MSPDRRKKTISKTKKSKTPKGCKDIRLFVLNAARHHYKDGHRLKIDLVFFM